MKRNKYLHYFYQTRKISKKNTSHFQNSGCWVICFVIALQLTLTIFNVKTMWPLCPYNMFNWNKSLEQNRDFIDLTLKDGSTFKVSPFHILPIEYFKSFRIIKRSLEMPTLQKKLFYQFLLKRLNDQPHGGFDEIYSSPKSSKKNPFVNIAVKKEYYHLSLIHI